MGAYFLNMEPPPIFTVVYQHCGVVKAETGTWERSEFLSDQNDTPIRPGSRMGWEKAQAGTQK